MKRFVAMLLAAVLLCSVIPLLTSCGSSGGSAQSSKEDAIIGEWTVYDDTKTIVWAFSKDGNVVWERYNLDGSKRNSVSGKYHWSESSGDTLLFIDWDGRSYFYVWCSELESTLGKHEQRIKLCEKYYSKYSESVNGYEYSGTAYVYDGILDIGYGFNRGLIGGLAFSAEKINKVTSTGPVGTFVNSSGGYYITFNADGTGILVQSTNTDDFVYTYDEATGIVNAYRVGRNGDINGAIKDGKTIEWAPFKLEGNRLFITGEDTGEFADYFCVRI